MGSGINETSDVLIGGTDGTAIGNIGDRMKVDSGLSIDPYTGATTVIDQYHAEIHEGCAFSHEDTHDLGNNQVYYYLLKTPAAPGSVIHYRASIDCVSQGRTTFFEGATVSDNGTPVTTVNRNRLSSNTSELLLYEAPTVTTEGTQLSVVKFGLNGGKTAVGAADQSEMILKRDTNYLVRLTSFSSGNTFNIGMYWYEVEVT